MIEDEAQGIWSDYQRRSKNQRLEEAVGLWKLMRSEGVRESTILALDFTHLGNSTAAG
jgi:hypothetical protein